MRDGPGALSDVESSWDVAAAAVIWKFDGVVGQFDGAVGKFDGVDGKSRNRLSCWKI